MVDPRFPSLKARALFRVLTRDLGYELARQKGSHRTLRARGRPQIVFAYHDGTSLAPGIVADILCKQAGLDIETALALF